MREVVQARYPVPCVFLQGASGDLGPRDGFVGDPGVADRNGRWLGFAALAALESPLPPDRELQYAGAVMSGASIGVWEARDYGSSRRKEASRFAARRWTFDAEYRGGLPTLADAEADLALWLEREQAAATDHERLESRAMVERATRLMSRVATLPDGETYPLQVHAWSVGEGIWLVLQGEPYQWLQTELRRRLAPRPLVVTTVAADWGASYLPPRDIYDTEIYQESIAVLAPGTLEALVDHLATELLRLK